MAEIFNADGTYNKTNWMAGDTITASKLNKIEESLEAINNNDISRHVEADTRLDALEAKDVAHDKELTNIKNTIADNNLTLNVEIARIDTLIAEKATIEDLEAIDAKIENLDVGDLTAVNAEIENLKAKDVAHDKELTNIKNTIADNNPTGNTTSGTINIDNFNDIQEAIDYAKESKKKITGNKITLDRNVSFRGVELDVNILDIKEYTVELGGYYVPDVAGQPTTNPPQIINKILRTVGIGYDQVFIRGAVGQKIRIGQYYGNVNLRMNETDTYNAYSTFEFGYVYSVIIGNDENVPSDTTKILWCNENVFYINRCNRFIIDGTFPHDLNRIYGGSFEGASTIEIRTGRCNTFYDMRFEGSESVTIKFGKNAINNRIYRNDNYPIKIEDKGCNNGIVTQRYRDVVLLSNQSITTSSFNENYLGMFSNLTKTVDGLGIKPTNHSLAILYESEFIDHPSTAMFVAKCSRKVGNGIAVKYSLYDENYNLLDNSSDFRSAFYLNTNNYTSVVVNKDEGAYVSPGAQAANAVDCTGGIYNDNVNLTPSSHFANNENSHLIKYVKFFIISSAYINPDAEYYDITASVYRMNGSLYTKYFY